jgi:hypothetical protein
VTIYTKDLRRRAVLAVLVLTLAPSLVSADMGVPMVAVFLPPAWLALIPIILIEAAIGIRQFGLPTRKAILGQALANSISTLVGLPVTWAVLAVLQLRFAGTALGLMSIGQVVYAVTIQAPWMIPYESELWWMIPVGLTVLTLVFYGMSVVIEEAVLRRVFREIPAAIIRSWALRANAASYGFLWLLVLSAFTWPRPFAWLFSMFAPITDRMMEVVLVAGDRTMGL